MNETTNTTAKTITAYLSAEQIADARVILQSCMTPIVRILIDLPRYADAATLDKLIGAIDEDQMVFGVNLEECVRGAVYDALYDALDKIFAPAADDKGSKLTRSNKICKMCADLLDGKHALLTRIQLEDLINGTNYSAR